MRPALPALLLGTALLTLGAAPAATPNPATGSAPGILVAYPPEGHRVAFDHVILEGMVPPGATLTVSGTPVPTGPDGLYISWFPLKPGVNDLRLIARTPARPGQSARSTTRILRVTRTVPRTLPATPTTITRASITPAQPTELWDPAGDTPQDRQIPVRFQGSPGGRASARIASLPPQPLREGPAGTYSGTLDVPPTARLSSAALTVTLTGRDGRTTSAPAPGRVTSAPGTARTVTTPPGTIPGPGLNASSTRLTTTQGAPLLYPRDGTTYRAVGRVGPDLRVRLAPGLSALITASQTTPTGFTPPPAPGGGPLTLRSTPDQLQLHLPLGPARPPFTLTQTGERTLRLTLYATPTQPLTAPEENDPRLDRLTITTPAPGVTQLDLTLQAPIWGFHAEHDDTGLLLTTRQPPTPDPTRPLQGRVITLDPGHGGTQNGGAGSLGTPEKNLVLPITLITAQLLEAQGATVVLTRDTDTTLGLYERGLIAEAASSDLLISIHANALPDGRDPRGTRGPEIYYTHQQARGAAQAILTALRTNLPDLGPGAGLKPDADLALTRPTTQPSLLVETGYLTDPGNLRLLNSPDGQRRVAQAIADGISAYYAGLAGR
ncbi:N-acetylmuramoyl-L-alanine amidase family protein [Deinococcus soli (ex Cha et al. 2016)]|uniref:N-acetylmuramoyl-L-alanine amidase n=1 Tax=Deinococcus soli (ex Cha et al. 2016) TaxID=1309411 RepID=A0A0F7JPM7_9DEIO|nr:N-acetylmuramoyl-L-alanine amidase [Deinococcus soli (ex Cha et al. 2016)]AKH17712.1 N-acetylmuramoyl-L-alanine amidase [Deinococcus soli (ex Cha et al. 2016)]